ncbi:ATP-binding protein [Litoreibacter albidus]|uniref:histidine kinase n=1 Tax=Litoreibacter albidus TaxID=670155 RepID=A0A1H2T2T8_9RHOB|nr:ATP-binding protein [Litoreibacter albidus]SDW38168.1 two-component system, OmpR family, phosphate regulon sensor histidine kinase PhoR [Litoreibacter albidus]
MTVETLMEGIPLPLMVVDQSRMVTLTNSAMAEVFGRETSGANVVSLLRQAPVLAAIDGCLDRKTAGSARFIMSGQSGENVYLISASPLPDDTAVLCFEDQSRQEESEMMRRDFVANISHELRTPLTSLMGFIETLRGPARGDVDAHDRFLTIMEQEAQRMNRMVSDLLSLSRVEVDERIRPRDRIDLASVLRSVIATLEGKLSDADITVAAADLEQEFSILGDRDQLTQLFLNLIENAIKYGGAGKTIHVGIQRLSRDQPLRQPAIQVEIRDEGEGIDEMHLPRLTERFYRVDDHRSRDQGGTGLGLAIVKHIVNRHRGRLEIKSDQGVGSRFSVFFPAGP